MPKPVRSTLRAARSHERTLAMSCKRILSVSHDVLLLSIRAALLKQGGYEVVSIFGNATEQCKKGGFDLFLVGHSIADAEVDDMIAAWRRRCSAPIILIRRSFDHARDGTSHYVDSLDPNELMKTVATVLE